LNPVYYNETLWPGQLGHFFVILAFVGALFSGISYWRAAQTEVTDPYNSRSWLSLGRGSFVVHFISILGIFFALYYIITHHLFEFNYAYQHSSRALPMKYLLSSFWEGQEGSFMLWAFWQGLLGLFVMRGRHQLESRTMAVIALVQVALATMLLGFMLGDSLQIGTSPFVLLRDKMTNAPIFAMPNYLQFIEDGNGLNVLLQNYWMTIHPPVLFLGFSAVLIPFAYAVAAMWKGEYKSWIKPAQSWSLFAGGTLGLGIMMGGAWAYESLTFGGYWAWDPVENASLVPWLVLVAGLHTLIIFKATGRSLKTTLIFLSLAYLLVWYSTFLTRTGILGDTSVHAFTGEGSSLKYHLLIVLGLLMLLSFGLYFFRSRKMPVIREEEATPTREFWMFIGSFVLLLAALHIIIVTSIPVWSPLAKMISGKDVAPPVKVVEHYNSIQIWAAIFIGLLAGGSLFLKFRKTDVKKAYKQLGISAVIALVLTLFIGLTQKIGGGPFWLLLFAATFGISASAFYAFGVHKGGFRKKGAAITHFGFATMLLGILLSGYNKRVISLNTAGYTMNFGKESMEENQRESMDNVLLFRNTPVAMDEYYATYIGDSVSEKDPRTFYKVRYEKVNAKGETTEVFHLHPDAFINPKGMEGLMANPDSRHYLTHDVFTYVTMVLDPEKKTDTASWKPQTVTAGDTIYYQDGYLIFNGFNRQVGAANYDARKEDVAVGAPLAAYNLKGLQDTVQPLFVIRGNQAMQIEDTLREAGLFVRVANIIPDQDAAVIEVKQIDPKDDYIVLKAIVFPYINVLWLGVIIMVGGFMLSMVNRNKAKKEKVTG